MKYTPHYSIFKYTLKNTLSYILKVCLYKRSLAYSQIYAVVHFKYTTQVIFCAFLKYTHKYTLSYNKLFAQCWVRVIALLANKQDDEALIRPRYQWP